jgi:hypothetical protein
MKQVRFGDLKIGDKFNFGDIRIAEMHVKCDQPKDRGWYLFYGAEESYYRAKNTDLVWIVQSPEDRIKELEEENAKLKADLEAAKIPKLVNMDTLEVGDLFYFEDSSPMNLIAVKLKEKCCGHEYRISGFRFKDSTIGLYSSHRFKGDPFKVYKVN